MGTSARRLSSAALLTAVAATVLVFVSATGAGDGSDEGDGGGALETLAGFVLVLGPLGAAAVTRLVATSTLLRPVGGAVTVVAAGCAAVHVGVAIDEQGGAGWLYGAPALATVALLLAAVVRGRDAPRPHHLGETDDPARGAAGARRGREVAAPDFDDTHEDAAVAGPPLDVLTPLRRARNHAVRAVGAWLVVILLLGAVGVPVLRVMGWPRVVARLDSRVAQVTDIAERRAVRFEARTGGRRLEWRLVADTSSSWQVGDRTVGFLDDDGRVHLDQQFGLAGTPLLFPGLLLVGLALGSARRLWGFVVAWWDARSGGDRPRLGFVAVIDDPAPKAWRPLVAVWRSDPTRADRLPRPDAVYRADDEVGSELQSEAGDVVVRRAWIDTGPWPWAKPRWIGAEDGVVVPHRRSFFGSTYVRAITRRSDVGRVVPLRHGPPDPSVGPQTPAKGDGPSTPFGIMIAWRLVALILAFCFVLVESDRGRPVHVVGGPPPGGVAVVALG